MTNQRLSKMSDHSIKSTKYCTAAGVMIYIKCYVDTWYFNNTLAVTAGS